MINAKHTFLYKECIFNAKVEYSYFSFESWAEITEKILVDVLRLRSIASILFELPICRSYAEY